MNRDTLRDQALHLLRTAEQNPAATFRSGQLEAIEALVIDAQRVLLVQATGWGKSMVYWIATKLLRGGDRGPVLIVSPLLALMRNQQQAAERLGLQTVRWNSELKGDEREAAVEALHANIIDIVFTTPEQLAPDRTTGLSQALGASLARIPMLVVDEVHCISEWGHDFRPDYQRIAAIVQVLPASVPLLGTTATATSRVIEDIRGQFGADLFVHRGSLIRPGLKLGAHHLPEYAQRLAWLSDTLRHKAGSGIVYVLTQQDAADVAAWLVAEGIAAAAYHGGLRSEERVELEHALQTNEIRVLVATTALGMGFDKGDLYYVIHFQRPKSLIEYYQQVGRAGRQLTSAHGVLLSGAEDAEIVESLIESAVPARGDVEVLLRELGQHEAGLSRRELEQHVNLGPQKIETALRHLMLRNPNGPASVIVSEGKYQSTGEPVAESRWQEFELLSGLRRAEFGAVTRFAESEGCLMQQLREALDDPHPDPCGECQYCAGRVGQAPTLDQACLDRARAYLNNLHVQISPRLKWLGADWPELRLKRDAFIPLDLRSERGLALCRYARGEWGELVRVGKYHTGKFDERLISALAELLTRSWRRELAERPIVTFVPSMHRRELVLDLAATLATALQLPCDPAIVRKIGQTQAQKGLANSHMKANNLRHAFAVSAPVQPGQSLLLVDDIIDSGWTFSILSAQLRAAGWRAVYPVALASRYGR